MTVDYGSFVIGSGVRSPRSPPPNWRRGGRERGGHRRARGRGVGAGAIPGAWWVARGVLEGQVALHLPDPDTEIVLYCSAGPRSILAARALQDMGYRRVASLAGGFDRWKAEGRKWEVPVGLDAGQRVRYSRHLLLPEIGEAGQERLLASKVLLVGAGRPGLAGRPVPGGGRGGGRWASSTSTWSTPPTCSDRWCTTSTGWVGSRWTRPRRRCAGSTRRERGHLPGAAVGGQCPRDPGRVRPGRGRRRQLPVRYLMNDASLHLRIPVVHGSVLSL